MSWSSTIPMISLNMSCKNLKKKKNCLRRVFCFVQMILHTNNRNTFVMKIFAFLSFLLSLCIRSHFADASYQYESQWLVTVRTRIPFGWRIMNNIIHKNLSFIHCHSQQESQLSLIKYDSKIFYYFLYLCACLCVFSSLHRLFAGLFVVLSLKIITMNKYSYQPIV